MLSVPGKHRLDPGNECRGDNRELGAIVPKKLGGVPLQCCPIRDSWGSIPI